MLMLYAVPVFAGQGEPAANGNGGKPVKNYNIRGKAVDRHAVEMLLDESEVDGGVEMSFDGKTVKKLRGSFKLDRSKPEEEAAVDFIDRHRNAFGLKNPRMELKLIKKEVDKWGFSTIQYKHVFNGVPIWDDIVGVHLDENKNIERISSDGLIPTPEIETTPQITSEEALKIAKIDIGGENIKLFKPLTKLYIYDSRLVYHVTFIYEKLWGYFIDAKTREILDKEDLTKYDGAVR